jgi:cold shock CspA family protein
MTGQKRSEWTYSKNAGQLLHTKSQVLLEATEDFRHVLNYFDNSPNISRAVIALGILSEGVSSSTHSDRELQEIISMWASTYPKKAYPEAVANIVLWYLHQVKSDLTSQQKKSIGRHLSSTGLNGSVPTDAQEESSTERSSESPPEKKSKSFQDSLGQHSKNKPSKPKPSLPDDLDGIVVDYNASRGFGFIMTVDLMQYNPSGDTEPKELFFHVSEFDGRPEKGQHVNFDVEFGDKGLKAVDVTVVAEAGELSVEEWDELPRLPGFWVTDRPDTVYRWGRRRKTHHNNRH